jgi:alpha-tubulin suppressor-like RCC1 family protein
MAMSVSGKVWSWGNQWYGRLGNGQLGYGMQLSPAQMYDVGGSGFYESAKGVAAGFLHSVVMDQDGTVSAVGCNLYGALGDNTGISTAIPVKVLRSATPGDLLPDCVGVAAGDDFSMGLDSSGAVYAWGIETSGRLGNGSSWGSQLFAQPVQRGDDPAFPALDGIHEIANGRGFGMAREPNAMEVAGGSGKVWVWGENANGQLGQGNVTALTRAVTMKLAGGSELDHAWHVSGGETHSAVVRWEATDPDLQGSVWTCGDQLYGRLGQGSTWFGTITNPAKVIKADTTPLTGIVQVAAGSLHTLALDQDGHVWSWGYNNYGALGDGTTLEKGHAVQVTDAAGTGLLSDIVVVGAGGYGAQGSSMAIDKDAKSGCGEPMFRGIWATGSGPSPRTRSPVAHAQNHVDEGEPSVSLSCTVIESMEEGEVELTATPGHSGPLGLAAIQQVVFYVNGAAVGSASQAPWEVSVNALAAGRLPLLCHRA